MTVENPKVLISTGFSAIVPPRHLEEIYGPLKSDERFAGNLEAIAWIWLPFFLAGLKERGFLVVGQHGRTGAFLESPRFVSRALALSTNSLIMSTPKLLDFATQFRGVEYILVHGFDIQLNNHLDLIIAKAKANGESNQVKTFYVENNNSSIGLDMSLSIVRYLRATGVSAGLAFDLFHYFDSCRGSVDERINQTINELEQVLTSNACPVILHIPVGLNRGDSLPMEDINRIHWRRLAYVISGRLSAIVIEHQAEVSQSHLFLTKKQRDSHREHLLTQVGILTENSVI